MTGNPIDLAAAMMREVLQHGGVPSIVIGAKATGPEGSGMLDYFIVSPLSEKQIHYVLSRVNGLLNGSIPRDN